MCRSHLRFAFLGFLPPLPPPLYFLGFPLFNLPLSSLAPGSRCQPDSMLPKLVNSTQHVFGSNIFL